MDVEFLTKTAKALVAPGKGILAADESEKTIEKRFKTIGVESTEDTRRSYRELLFTTSAVEEFISGVILFDETLRYNQGKLANILKNKGIIPGIKVDKGAKDMANFPGEKITEGLDGLRERLVEYKNLGAQFTKWRAVIAIGDGIPTQTCITSNAESLARFAALSQEVGLVPIVEPEVLMDGGHTIERSEEVTTITQQAVFARLRDHKINFSGMLLKPNFVHPGKESGEKVDGEKVAQMTLEVLKRTVPPEVPGVVFLSGGDSPTEAIQHLDRMNEIGNVPWQISFSYGRALQEPVLKAWQGKEENVESAKKEFYERARLNSLARFGKYESDMEKKENG